MSKDNLEKAFEEASSLLSRIGALISKLSILSILKKEKNIMKKQLTSAWACCCALSLA
jgi:hypothetical protein